MATQPAVRYRVGEIKGGALGLSEDVCRQVCDLLNTDLASEFVLYHQYKKHHWVVEGPEFASLHKLLDEHADGVRELADEIAERMTYLGGVPYSRMSTLEQKSFIQCEDEGVFDLREMLERDRQANITMCQRLRQQIEQCRSLKDYGTEFCLMEWTVKHEKWVHELDALLAQESLTKAIGHPGGRPTGA
ncbi:MAG: DNA starvation/stationary phase protection protein [Chloroflexi bacterium]|nr:DNA starvation/stationary phase protection protein [Chloroflexota bacterium]